MIRERHREVMAERRDRDRAQDLERVRETSRRSASASAEREGRPRGLSSSTLEAAEGPADCSMERPPVSERSTERMTADRAQAWHEKLTTPVRSQSRERAARPALAMTFPRRGAATRTSSARRSVEAPKIDAASRSSLQEMLSSLQADVTRLRARAGGNGSTA